MEINGWLLTKQGNKVFYLLKHWRYDSNNIRVGHVSNIYVLNTLETVIIIATKKKKVQ